MKEIILASGSPRRKEIFMQVGIDFKVEESKIEEVSTAERPCDMVMELALMKALEVANNHLGDCIVIGADTAVCCDNNVLGKPKSEVDAINMINNLQGKSHHVLTGVAIVEKEAGSIKNKFNFYEDTKVIVASMSSEEINAYVATKEPVDKAGAYAIQGLFAKYILRIEGDYYNVVGFPIARLFTEIKNANIELIAKK